MGVKLHNSFQVIIKAIFIDTLLFIIYLLDKIPELFVSQKVKEKREKTNEILVRIYYKS